MRYRLMATYLGVPYHAGLGPDGDEVTLFSPGPPPDELGFSALAGHWRKQVGLDELDALWQSRLVGDYRGEPCLVLDDLDGRLHIAYLGRDTTRASQLGYWEIDREVFEVMVPRSDVTDLTEERVEYPLAAAMFPPPAAAPGDAEPAVVEPAVAGPGGAAPVVAEPGAPGAPGAPGGPGGPAGPERVAATSDRAAAWHGSPVTDPWEAGRVAVADGVAAAGQVAVADGRRTARRDRVSLQAVFAELLDLAAIPHTAYAVDEEVPGAMCLVKADGGFEVFCCSEDARLEVRFFDDEEAAYFYLFGILAAEAVRSGRLAPRVNGSRGPGLTSAERENVSNRLQS